MLLVYGATNKSVDGRTLSTAFMLLEVIYTRRWVIVLYFEVCPYNKDPM